MGYDIGEVRHLEYFVEANGVDPAGIEVVGAGVDEVRRPFRRVALGDVVPRKFRIHDRNACSSCMNAFLLSCSLLDGEPARFADVYMGSMLDESEAAGEMSIAFGNCCPTSRAFDLRIRGCPPYPFALKGSLKVARR